MLIDFSNAMARSEAAAYHDTFDVCTLAYRAPEVLYGLPFDCKIDLWSLGVTLAELYSGRAFALATSRAELAAECAPYPPYPSYPPYPPSNRRLPLPPLAGGAGGVYPTFYSATNKVLFG